MKSIKQQKGVALFVTLLVVAIATLLATEMWFNNSLDISRQYNNQASYQANHYAKGMMLWAKDILRQDAEGSDFDSSTEVWNQPIAGIQLDDAVLSGHLSDLDSKFNLNNLLINGVVNEPSRAYFIRILNNLELDIGIADKIIDWLDADQIPRALGAEDVVYLSKRPSYRTAGQAFIHISELRLVDGISEQVFQRLKSFVTVLPIVGSNPTTINVNTASTLLLKSLDARITTRDALMLYNDGNAAHQTLADFYRQPVIVYYNLNNSTDLNVLLSTQSRWFHAQVNITMEQTVFHKYALIFRNPNPVIRQYSDTSY
ncbi:hypothetical protein MNBD_GAMMA01-92 [hydrothermal vent metagenome]|uniref:T2SS protein K first SAM-like domain-containing protein n=1 Tax=hydrothermal vent metagenome TaxID=652676 RepID=A0A3B0URI3_9ZZZZ